MESCRVTYLCVSSVGTNSQHETKLIPTTVIVRLVDAHFACEQANDKCDRGDDPMPESGPKTRRLGTRLLVSGVRPSDGEDICHNWGVSVSPRASAGSFLFCIFRPVRGSEGICLNVVR